MYNKRFLFAACALFALVSAGNSYGMKGDGLFGDGKKLPIGSAEDKEEVENLGTETEKSKAKEEKKQVWFDHDGLYLRYKNAEWHQRRINLPDDLSPWYKVKVDKDAEGDNKLIKGISEETKSKFKRGFVGGLAGCICAAAAYRGMQMLMINDPQIISGGTTLAGIFGYGLVTSFMKPSYKIDINEDAVIWPNLEGDQNFVPVAFDKLNEEFHYHPTPMSSIWAATVTE